MNTGMNNIHVNPNFIPKCQPKIHLNPSFVNAQKFDILNSHSDNVYVPAPNHEHNLQINNLYHATSSSSYHDGHSNIENSLPHCQIYSNQSSNLACNAFSYNSFHKGNQSLHRNEAYEESRNNFRTDYLNPNNLPVSVQNAPGNDILNTSAGNNLDQLSNGQKPNIKSVIMGQRMIKNQQQIFPTNNVYSVDHRKTNILQHSLPKSTSSYIGKSLLSSQPSFKVQSQILNEIPSNNNRSNMQTLRSFASNVPFQNINSVTQIGNGISSLCSINTKDKVPSSDSYQAHSIANTSLASSMLNIGSVKSKMPLPDENVNNSTTNCSPIFEDRSTFFKSSMKLVRRDTLRKSAKFIREDLLVKKRIYAVKTKTKLIRRNSSASKYPKFNHISRLSKLRRSLKLRKGTLLKAREKMMSTYSRPNINKPINQKSLFKSKYKFVKDGVHISRFKVNRNPHPKTISSSSPSKSKLSWSLKLKRNLKKSDKFINISGNLYKSTATSLKMQDLSPKSKRKTKTPSPRNKFKKFAFRNSKFVYRRQSSVKLESGTLIEIVRRKKLAHFKRVNDYCFFYNKYGNCKKQNKGCPFVHDPSKIAICTRFLQGTCTEISCSFSHIMDKNKMPVCSHFQDGLCSKENCPYRHVRVNPKAPVCKNFLKGHCPHGEECKKKHILICEDFNKDGQCPRGKKCPLSHRDPKKKSKNSKLNSIVSTRKKQKKKIGVLGLVSKGKTEIKVGKGQSSNNRYFDSPEQKNSNSKENEPSPKGDISTDLEAKRARLFRKVETLKRNYHVGVEDVVGSKDNKLQESKPSQAISMSDAASNSDITSQEQAKFRLGYLPVPDVMPSIIPLVLPEYEV